MAMEEVVIEEVAMADVVIIMEEVDIEEVAVGTTITPCPLWKVPTVITILHSQRKMV